MTSAADIKANQPLDRMTRSAVSRKSQVDALGALRVIGQL
jgi:hypothetical protein